MNNHEYLFYTDLIKKDKEELIELVQMYSTKLFDMDLEHRKEIFRIELDKNKLIADLKSEISRLERQLEMYVITSHKGDK